MDIIAAHRDGLLEQLDEEVAALAGRALDHGQRAIVLHHLYDHARGGHWWALGEARRALRIASRVAQLERLLSRWRWSIRRPAEARQALDRLAAALGEEARLRTAAAYRSYRLTATAALRDEALPPVFRERLDECHAARRAGSDLPAEACRDLAAQCDAYVTAISAGSTELHDAWAAIEASGLARPTRRLLSEKRLARDAQRDGKLGLARLEKLLRDDPVLPAAFRANPAQHFYALLRGLVERRRNEWRKACDDAPDAVALAA